MSDFLESFRDPQIIDPLSDVTRKERKSLLLASLIALAVSKGGLIPQEISALGIKVSAFERVSLLYLLVLVLLYFILGFSLYAAADLKAYRVRVTEAADQRRQAIQETLGPKSDRAAVADTTDQADVEKLALLADRSQMAEDVLKVSRLRYIFEFYLPLIVGWGAVALTLTQAVGSPGFLWVVSLSVAVIISMAIGYYLQVRERLKRRWQWWKQNRPMRLLQKKMKQAQTLAPDSKEREKLMAEINQLLGEMGRPKTTKEQQDRTHGKRRG